MGVVLSAIRSGGAACKPPCRPDKPFSAETAAMPEHGRYGVALTYAGTSLPGSPAPTILGLATVPLFK